MTIRELRSRTGYTQSDFSKRYNIPVRTIQNWEAGVRNPPDYLMDFLSRRIMEDLTNRRINNLPDYRANNKDLPRRNDFIGAVAWLKAVRDVLGENIVFALDEALMCCGLFTGRSDESIVWIYGDDSAEQFNGVAVIGNAIDPFYVREKNGLRFTSFNRTLYDSLSNESILDMQGITEALSRYYFSHNESFEGIFLPPELVERFSVLAEDAINYYSE